jgi:hypothetical protein
MGLFNCSCSKLFTNLFKVGITYQGCKSSKTLGSKFISFETILAKQNYFQMQDSLNKSFDIN